MIATNGTVPSNIKMSWWVGLTARLQQAASSQNGYAVVSIKVMVDPNGDPVMWTAPEVTRIEPMKRGGEFLEAIISSIGG